MPSALPPRWRGGMPVNYGTMTKPLHCGNSARNGLMAAMLASKGFTSHAAVFEGNNGYFGELQPFVADGLRAVPGPRPPLGHCRDRLPSQELSMRRARAYCDRSGADVAREDRWPRRGYHQHPLLDVAGERQAHQHRLSARRGGGEVLCRLCARLFAPLRRAQDQGLQRGGAQGRAHARNGEACHRKWRPELERRGFGDNPAGCGSRSRMGEHSSCSAIMPPDRSRCR